MLELVSMLIEITENTQKTQNTKQLNTHCHFKTTEYPPFPSPIPFIQLQHNSRLGWLAHLASAPYTKIINRRPTNNLLLVFCSILFNSIFFPIQWCYRYEIYNVVCYCYLLWWLSGTTGYFHQRIQYRTLEEHQTESRGLKNWTSKSIY
jgi:hypothetical protein